jgi:hypothetical protein
MRKLMAVLAFALAACGGSGNNTSGAGASQFATACAGLLAAEAGLMKTCSKVNPALFLPNGMFEFSRVCDFLESEIVAGRVHYDASQFAACLTAYQAVTCADLPPGDPTGDPATKPAACAAAFTGTVAVNAACFAGADCSNGFCSSDTSRTCPGTCQPFRVAGESCSAQQCGPGLACTVDPMAVTTSCKATGAVGAACPCQPGLWCNTANAGGRCETAIAPGGACAAYSTNCRAGYQCQGATTATPGTCQPIVGQGGACTVRDQCGFGYQCQSGTCSGLPTLGQDCSTTMCAQGYCDSAARICTAYLADGATCSSAPGGCLSGTCNPNTLKCERSICRP